MHRSARVCSHLHTTAGVLTLTLRASYSRVRVMRSIVCVCVCWCVSQVLRYVEGQKYGAHYDSGGNDAERE